MDSGTVDSPVTLVIKAPNQKYDDQTINCFLNWTVEKLKCHISNVYPSKPSSGDQRLVYSGQLLQDDLQLRDILRKQDGYQTMHLVCASPSPQESPTPGSPAPGTSDPCATSSETTGTTSQARTTNQDGQPSTSSVTGSNDGLRHRGCFPPFNSLDPTSTGVTQWADGTQVPVQGAAAGMPPRPVYHSMQVLWWQQMYARHYYMRYQAAVAASQPPSIPPYSPSPTLSPQPAQPNEPPAPLGPNLAPNPIPEDRPANPNIQMNAQGGAVLNEDELNRDWLDWMYTVSRAAILFSVVYFYSSFSRFTMVIGAMVLVYLHQAGWFPFRPDLQNQRRGGGLGHQEQAERHHDFQEMERIMDEGLEDQDGDSGEESPEDPASPRHPGFLVSAWSFIKTFITSLIPEGPPHPAN